MPNHISIVIDQVEDRVRDIVIIAQRQSEAGVVPFMQMWMGHYGIYHTSVVKRLEAMGYTLETGCSSGPMEDHGGGRWFRVIAFPVQKKTE